MRLTMEKQITIEAEDCFKHVSFKPAIYMNTPLWEITLDERTYIIRRNVNGIYQCSDSSLDPRLLEKIGSAIDCLTIKNAS